MKIKTICLLAGFVLGLCVSISITGLAKLSYPDIQESIIPEVVPEIVHELVTPEKVTIPTEPEKIEKCKEDIQCAKLAEAVVYESRQESFNNQLRVASVIVNRSEHKNFPNTITKVINQPSQFSYINNTHRQKTPSKKSWKTGYLVAYKAYIEDVRNTEALFFINPKAVKRLPKWALVYNRIEISGNHHFYTY